MTIATAHAVTRTFGEFTAVDDMHLDIEAGEIVGLLGANGAGKTTLIKMLIGLLTPTAGSIRLFGEPHSRHQRRRIGYVPQNLGLYADLTTAENLDFRAHIYDRNGATNTDSGHADRQHKRQPLIGDQPLGVQRRVAFDAATQHAPELLVLDEPTSGVSPLARSRLWDLIHEQTERDVGVLVSTHYMDEAEQADRLAIMSQGRLVAAGTTTDVVDGRQTVVIRTNDWSGALEAVDRPGRHLRLAGRDVRVLGEQCEHIRADLDAACVAADVHLAPATLEEVLIELDSAADSEVTT